MSDEGIDNSETQGWKHISDRIAEKYLEFKSCLFFVKQDGLWRRWRFSISHLYTALCFCVIYFTHKYKIWSKHKTTKTIEIQMQISWGDQLTLLPLEGIAPLSWTMIRVFPIWFNDRQGSVGWLDILGAMSTPEGVSKIHSKISFSLTD